MRAVVPLCVLPLCLLLVACGGTYSNEDLDFQEALPRRADLAVEMPSQMLAVEGASEYLRDTRATISLFNRVTDAFLSIVDTVRAHPPTTRMQDTRTWGPYPDGKDRAWVVRMVMERADDPRLPAVGFRFQYAIQVRRASAGEDGWLELMRGAYWPGGGPRAGLGELLLDTTAARAAGYPVDDPADPGDLNDLERLAIAYDRVGTPRTMTAQVRNRPGAENVQMTFAHEQRPDGTGRMDLTSSGKQPEGPEGIAWQMHSRWAGDGAGRADVRLAAFGLGLLGVDCWNAQGQATYVRRDWQTDLNRGSALTCAFGEATSADR